MSQENAPKDAGRGQGLHFLRYGVPVIAVAAAIFALSQMSASTINDSSAYDTTSNVFGRFTDEVAHFAEYFLLSFLILRWIIAVKIPRDVARPDAAVLRALAQRAFALSVLYAISDEIHQWLVGGRSAELLDLVIDAGGALVGAAFYLSIYQAWRFQKARPEAREKRAAGDAGDGAI